MVVEVAAVQGQVNIHQRMVQTSLTALLIHQGRPTLQRMHTAVMPLQKIHTLQPVKVVHLTVDQEITLQTLPMVLVILSLIRGANAVFFFFLSISWNFTCPKPQVINNMSFKHTQFCI